jgi:regulator of protease activity HflC (stomatin/prohibitin superfamily)
MSYIIVVVLVIFGLAGIRIADQYVRGVVFRLGRYHTTKGPGLYWIIPLVEWQRRVDLRINTAAVEQQETITKDNVPIKVNAVVWYRIVNPMASVLEVKNIDTAVIQVALTTLRTGIGQHSLDEVLKEQEAVANIIQGKIDAVTEPWGVKVVRVEMKNVEIPQSMQRVMAQEAEALREKRARIIKAQAEFKAAEQLRKASEIIMQNPAGLELRRMQMITEVGAEQNTMTIIMMPSEFVAMAKNLGSADLRVEPHRQSGLGHKGLGVAHGKFAEVKDRGRQHGAGMAVANAFDQMLEIADAAGGDHRHGHRIRHRAGERNIEALPCAVAIHRSKQDLSGPERHHLSRIVDGIEAGRLAAAMGEDFPALVFARLRHFLGVDGDDDALIAEFFRRFLHESAARHGRRIDRDLVGAGGQQRTDVVDGAHAAADGERHKARLGGALHHVEHDVTILVARGDVEKGELVGAGLVIGDRRFHRIAGIAQVDEVDAFDDPAVFHVEAGNDADFEHA